MTKLQNSENLRHQRGAATLVVVMVLFLIMALLAAYANRSLLFEQRIAASYFRASLSQEAAEAAVEWSLAQLNGTALNASCQPVNNGGQRFADKYLQINASDRSIVPSSADMTGIVDCSHDTAKAGWACRCPAADVARTPSTAAADAEPSSFTVRFFPGSRGGTVMLKTMGCTDSVPDNCLLDVSTNAAAISDAMVGKTKVSALIGLVGAVRSPPAAPLVVVGDIDSPGGGLGLHNTDSRSAGMLAIMGGAWPDKGDARLESVPGTLPSQAITQSGELNAPHQAFKMFMGASVSSYLLHPSLRTVTCDSDCATALNIAYKAGQRILWIEGPMAISSSTVLGSINDPMVVIATGDVALSGAFQFNGMLVTLGKLTWTNVAGASALINGMVLVGGKMQTIGGGMDIVYQRTVADQLSNRIGSYVRVPGGWIDAD